MLKLKLQYFGHLMWRTDSFEKTLMLGKIEGGRRRDDRGWDGWMASRTQWTWVWVNFRSWWCHPTISSSVVPFSPALNLSQHQDLFQWVGSSHQVAKSWSFSFSIGYFKEYSGLISFMGLDSIIFVFWMLSFKPAFSLAWTWERKCCC